jgi:hypothetical protein
LRDVAGADFITMPRFASPPTVSWSRIEAVFRPRPALDSSNLPYPSCRPHGSPAGRAQRHNPHSMATLRKLIARSLLARFPCCSFCCAIRV